ncbi:MAG: sulfatase-like hydrolase/transferase [Rikenellaceae bacterium]
MNTKLTIAAAGAISLQLMQTTVAATDKQPNVLFIITDQQSLNTISAYKGITPENYCETPNMDKLVERGTSFMNCYCPNPGSMPSRFAMFTGVYGGAYEIRSNNGKHLTKEKVTPVIKSNAMGWSFANAGYETIYGGKTHLAFAGLSGKGVSMHGHPDAYGFSTYLGEDERGKTAKKAADLLRNRKSSDKPFLMVTSFINPHDICMEGTVHKSKDKYPKATSNKLEERVGMVKTVRAEMAAIDREEFFAKHAPHLPYNFEPTAGYPEVSKRVSEKFTDEYWRQYRWVYKRLVSKVDDHIGTILDGLDANPAVKKNTIIVFVSDHGEMQGAHRAITKGYPYDECQQVPLIIVGGGAKANAKVDLLVSGVDIYPTLCELTGVKSPEKMDGVSLAAVAKGKSKKIARDVVYGENQTFVNVVKGDYKYTYFDLDDKEMLVNLKSDPGEMQNLLTTDSAKYRKVADELRSDLMKIYEPRKAAMMVESEFTAKAKAEAKAKAAAANKAKKK